MAVAQEGEGSMCFEGIALDFNLSYIKKGDSKCLPID
jgi:hypothetical protein